MVFTMYQGLNFVSQKENDYLSVFLCQICIREILFKSVN